MRSRKTREGFSLPWFRSEEAAAGEGGGRGLACRCTLGNFNVNNYRFDSLEACNGQLRELRKALERFKGVPCGH